MNLSPGVRIGQYEIIAEIGAGVMGEVYRARDTKLGREVAIEMLPTDIGGDSHRLGRFQHEAHRLASRD